MVEACDITPWLDTSFSGDRAALDRLVVMFYPDLQALARRQLARQHGHSLDVTTLVHESYIKLLAASAGVRFDDRPHFLAYVATAMRSVLIDDARNRQARKRGGDLRRVAEIPEEHEGAPAADDNLLALDLALQRLRQVDRRLADVVELRYLGGLSELEIAARQHRSERSIRRDWQKARQMLMASIREL